jgi:hypothetical protein
VASVTAPIAPVIGDPVRQAEGAVSAAKKIVAPVAHGAVAQVRGLTAPITDPLRLPPVSSVVTPVVDPITGPVAQAGLPIRGTPGGSAPAPARPGKQPAGHGAAQANPDAVQAAAAASPALVAGPVSMAGTRTGTQDSTVKAGPAHRMEFRHLPEDGIAAGTASDIPVVPANAGSAGGSFATTTFFTADRSNAGKGNVIGARQGAAPLWRSLKPGTSPD